MEGSFRDLHVNTSNGGGRGGARGTNGGGGGSPMANYSTFSTDQVGVLLALPSSVACCLLPAACAPKPVG